MTLSAPNNPVDARGKASKRADCRHAAMQRRIRGNLDKPTFRDRAITGGRDPQVGRRADLRRCSKDLADDVEAAVRLRCSTTSAVINLKGGELSFAALLRKSTCPCRSSRSFGRRNQSWSSVNFALRGHETAASVSQPFESIEIDAGSVISPIKPPPSGFCRKPTSTRPSPVSIMRAAYRSIAGSPSRNGPGAICHGPRGSSATR